MKPDIYLKLSAVFLVLTLGVVLLTARSQNETPQWQPVETTQPNAQSARSQTNKTQKSKAIRWASSYEAAIAQAKREGKPVMIDFHAVWCPNCKTMDAKTFPDERVVQATQNFVSVKVDTDKRMDLARKFKVYYLPTIVWISADGQTLERVETYLPPDEFVQWTNAAFSKFAPSQTRS